MLAVPSTINGDSRPIQGPSDSQKATNSIRFGDSSSNGDQRQSACYWWAVLQDLRLQHNIEKKKLCLIRSKISSAPNLAKSLKTTGLGGRAELAKRASAGGTYTVPPKTGVR
ncbi:hypothetical protein PSTG_02644 [Puccinia striiformis f. sp. tritici PST-78]|uniref:Uncharacterized protein n=1 Tax=Puccinia striiformis f. sp. tritici PST-78 TaxID=1165861 RepID=A0A0L0VYN0_9BASI|nr:hypothetical protein PSTG_02644 [Puccinia striiformis f. sp. tritici PST-78]